MKKIDLFCASPSSTAICSSTVDIRRRYRPHHRHQPPCNSSRLPIIPKPVERYYHEKNLKSLDHHHSYSHKKSSLEASDLTSPCSSSRYLLSDKAYKDYISESDNDALALVPSTEIFTDSETSKTRHVTDKQAPSPSTNNINNNKKSRHQVVVLRVSIHCKGCEGKVRKHISRMEGVTSFSIDLAAKKVTVVGNVTPLGVLASISRVKNAQLWPSSTSSSPSPSPSPSPSSFSSSSIVKN